MSTPPTHSVAPTDALSFYGPGGAHENLKPYSASCFCGLIAYSLFAPDLSQAPVTQCNCSWCRTQGLYGLVVWKDDVFFTSGEDRIKEFRWNTQSMPHRFCPECSTNLFVWHDNMRGPHVKEGWEGKFAVVNVSSLSKQESKPRSGMEGVKASPLMVQFFAVADMLIGEDVQGHRSR
jgi:hypothetical protein